MGPKATDSASPHTPAESSTAARRVKGKRTRTGCLTCRARKVKCDEQPGTCANCERVCLACKWPVVRNVLEERGAVHPRTASGSRTELSPQLTPSSGPIRWSRHGSCAACRGARARCSQDRPTCARCSEQHIQCDYAPLPSGAGATPSSVEESPSEADGDSFRAHPNLVHGIPRSIVERHVEAFFTHVYPVQGNAVVHRGTLLKDIADGNSSRNVVLAVCAVASRFVEVTGTPNSATQHAQLAGTADANRWAADAKAALVNSDMSLDNIAATLLLAKHDIYSGRFGQAFVLSAMATRMALALSLHNELPAEADVSRTERETRRRLMYGCYSLDRMMSTGVPEFLCTPAASIHTRLPCVDQKYNFSIETETPILELESQEADDVPSELVKDVGLFGQHIRLMSIRALILRVARNRKPTDLMPWDPASLFALAERKLKNWFSSLPPQFQLEPETIYARQFQNELTPLTMLHVWYNTNAAELTRIAMPGFTESLPPNIISQAPPGWVQSTRDECVSHARFVARTLRHVASFVDMDNLIFGDPSLPICAYESARSRLQYAFLLPSEMQPEELSELTADVAVMASFLERMGRYFKNCKWLLREMRKMMRRHGLDPGSDLSEPSQPSSPNAQDPWSRRVRTIREHAPRRPAPPLPVSAHSYPSYTGTVAQIGSQHRETPPRNASLPVSATANPASSEQMLQPPSSISMYPEPSLQGNTWQNNGHDEVAALLGELGQAQAGIGGNTGTGGMSFLGMFADWVATGYDGSSIGLNGVM